MSSLISDFWAFMTLIVEINKPCLCVLSSNLYCYNWSFFPGVFLYISLPSLCLEFNTVLRYKSHLYLTLKLRFHCRSGCFDAVFQFILYIYKKEKKWERFLNVDIQMVHLIMSCHLSSKIVYVRMEGYVPR